MTLPRSSVPYRTTLPLPCLSLHAASLGTYYAAIRVQRPIYISYRPINVWPMNDQRKCNASSSWDPKSLIYNLEDLV